MVRTQFSSDSKVGMLWKDMKSLAVSGGTGVERLETLVDVGYVKDPLGGRQFGNVNDVIEGPEVLNFAYDNSSYHRLLAKHGFPTFTFMDDFDDRTWVDNQRRKDIEDEIGRPVRGGTLAAVDRARKVFDWSLKSMRFFHDCPVESTAWSALTRNCGYSSEAASALFYPYERAGLNPAFYVEGGLEPTLRWVDRYYQKGATLEEHVLLGVPDTARGSVIFVDRIDEEFGAPHPLARKLTRMEYEAVALGNLAIDSLFRGQRKEAISSFDLQREMLPDDIFNCFKRGIARMNTDPKAKEDIISEMERRFANHPAKKILKKLIVLGTGDSLRQLANKEGAFVAELAALDSSRPNIAAKTRIMIGFVFLGSIITKTPTTAETDDRGGGDAGEKQQTHQGSVSLLSVTAEQFLKALEDDPNSVTAWMGLFALIKKYSGIVPSLYSIVLDEVRRILVKHPKHTPLLAIAANCSVSLAILTGGDKKKEFAAEYKSYVERIVTAEPDHWRGHLLLADTQMLVGDREAMQRSLAKVKGLVKTGLPIEYYQMRIKDCFREGNDRELGNLIPAMMKDRPNDGLEIILSFLREDIQVFLEKTKDVEMLRQRALKSKIPAMVARSARALASYPESSAVIRSIKVKWALFQGICLGGEVWRREVAAIGGINDKEVSQSLEEGLLAFGGGFSLQYQPQDVVDEVFKNLESIRRELPPQFNGHFLGVYVELMNNCIILGNKDKAGRIMDMMFAIDPSRAVQFGMETVINMTYRTLQQIFDALELFYERRDLIDRAVLGELKEAYQWLLTKSSADAAIRGEVEKRIEMLLRRP